MVKTDIDTPNKSQDGSICAELHPKLQYLNEIQLQFRGKVGGNTDKYLEEMWSPAPVVPVVPPPGAPDSPALAPVLPVGPPPGVPDSPALAPAAPQNSWPQASRLDPAPGFGPGPWLRPRPQHRPMAPAPGPWQTQSPGLWQAPAPVHGPAQGKRAPGTLAALSPPVVTPRPARPPAGTPRLGSHDTSLVHPRLPQDNSSLHYLPQARWPDKAAGPARPTTFSHTQHRSSAARPMAA